ncbi:LysE family translocator [Nitrogeniibacter aestuarii]|uniref:LysE family translocator n=1 Tax=Nitrogeniibacter aestuarii TaxID=2815343 RepID=UPI001D12ECDD|nr:LysE family translocator [Nitrogeniibacter aestuarii]
MAIEVWLLFCVTALVAAVSPGPAILLAITNGVAGGVRRVLWSSLGNVTGLICVASVSVFGLGALLKASSLAFTATKLLGAAYLIWLGVKQWRKPAVGLRVEPLKSDAAERPWHFWREGALVALTNPKALLFFTALFPVFLDAGRPLGPQFLIMTGTMMCCSFTCLMAYGGLAQRVRRWLSEPACQRRFQRVTGAVFMGMGTSLLVLTRPR